MLKSKNEISALILALISLILFFIPEIFPVEKVFLFRAGTALCLFVLLILDFFVADKRQKFILVGSALLFVLLIVIQMVYI